MGRKLWLWFLLLPALAGCSGETQVSGKILYEGKPVVLGTVVFVGADKGAQVAVIQPDGSFSITGLRPGPAKVAVVSYNPGQGDPKFDTELKAKFDSLGIALPAVKQDNRKWFPLPSAYASIETSPLTAEIKGGENHIDLHLKKT